MKKMKTLPRKTSTTSTLLVAILWQSISFVNAFVQNHPAVPPRSALTRLHLEVAADSQLAQLASMTTLSIDSGDLEVIKEFADTGYITDATTNPLFVSQAGLRGDPVYAQMVDDAVEYAIQHGAANNNDDDTSSIISLAIDRLAVNLGKSISDIVPGYV
jgi:hypothetical protein